MPNSTWPYRLLAPGPVPVPLPVLQAMSAKVLHHRTPEFEKILKRTWSGLQHVFATRESVLILAGTGSAAMEAAVVNTLSPGDEVLVVVSGKFGERWAEICETYQVRTHRWNIEWGEPAQVEAFEAELKKYPNLKAVFTQVCETSTATLHPIKDMSKCVRKVAPKALFAVDAITAAGCLPLPMDEWELDVVIGGSQKAFMIPTGLSFIALSERAWRAQAQARIPKFYFDLAGEKKANSKGETHFSTPTPLITGLDMVLARIEEVGIEKLYARTELLARITREAGVKLGLKVYSKAPSPSVTALLTVQDSGEIRSWLESERHITIMGGQDRLKGKIIRVGHMGDVRDDDMLALFEALSERLGQQPQWSEMKSSVANELKKVNVLFP